MLKTVKQTFLIQGAGTIITKMILLALGFSIGIVVARVLGPSGKGTVSVFQAIVIIILPLAEMGVRQSIAYFVGQKKYLENEIYPTMKALLICNSLLGLAIVYAVYQIMGLLDASNIWTALFFALFMPLSLFESYNTGILLGQKRIQRINFIQTVEKVTLFLFILIFLGYYRMDVLGVALSYFLASFIPAVILLYWFKAYVLVPPKLGSVLPVQMIRMGFVYAVGLLIMQLNYRVDMLMLSTMKNTQSVGIYSIGVNLCDLLKEIPIALGLVLFSRSAQWKTADVNDALQKVTFLSRVVFTAVAVLSILLSISAGRLIPILYGENFIESTKVLWILAPGVCVLSVFVILQLFMAGQGKPQWAIYIFAPALVLNIALNLFLIPKYDFIGASVSSAFTYSLATVIYIHTFNKKFRTKFSDFFFMGQLDLVFIKKEIGRIFVEPRTKVQ